MIHVFVANCKPHNWQACEREKLFGLKLGRTLPALMAGDLILFRITGLNYGVKAIWYFKESIKVDRDVIVPWTDGEYGWLLRCEPIISLPRVFSEDFRTSSKLSSKIPNFPASRIQPSIIPLKNFESKAYLEHLLEEFQEQFRAIFSYMGERKSVDGFMEEILSSLDKNEPVQHPGVAMTTTIEPVELESQEAAEYVSEIVGTPYGVVGQRVDLPILNYAPLNEQGVVLLFGYYLQDLGFSHLEEIRAGFPDAIAMRSIGGGRYKRVRIEFEYRSSLFVKHKHPIEGCDVIVCWLHDWGGCPLEVIELSKALTPEEA